MLYILNIPLRKDILGVVYSHRELFKRNILRFFTSLFSIELDGGRNEIGITNYNRTAPFGIDAQLHAWSNIQCKCVHLLLGAVHRGCHHPRRNEFRAWHCFYEDLAFEEHRQLCME